MKNKIEDTRLSFFFFKQSDFKTRFCFVAGMEVRFSCKVKRTLCWRKLLAYNLDVRIMRDGKMNSATDWPMMMMSIVIGSSFTYTAHIPAASLWWRTHCTRASSTLRLASHARSFMRTTWMRHANWSTMFRTCVSPNEFKKYRLICESKSKGIIIT